MGGILSSSLGGTDNPVSEIMPMTDASAKQTGNARQEQQLTAAGSTQGAGAASVWGEERGQGVLEVRSVNIKEILKDQLRGGWEAQLEGD